MENYANNSHKSREGKEEPKVEEKNIEQVTVGAVTRRKKPLGKKITEIFVKGDGQSVVSYIFMDVLVPSIKEMVTTAATQGIERMIFGEARTRPSVRPSGRNGYVSYGGYSNPSPANRDVGRTMSSKARATHNFDEIILDTRVEATEVLDNLIELISKYGTASVADLYSLVGISGSFTDNTFGWDDLRGSRILQTRQGYLLDLPAPDSIN